MLGPRPHPLFVFVHFSMTLLPIYVSNKDWKYLLLTSCLYTRSQFSIPNCKKFLVRFLSLFQKQKPSKIETFKNWQSPFSPEHSFSPKFGQKRPKIAPNYNFEILLRNFVTSFSWERDKMKTNTRFFYKKTIFLHKPQFS